MDGPHRLTSSIFRKFPHSTGRNIVTVSTPELALGKDLGSLAALLQDSENQLG